MKNKMNLQSFQRWLVVGMCLLTIAVAVAQPANAPGGRGGQGGPGGGGRGFGGPPLSEAETATVSSINTELAAEALAVTVASSNLVVASYSTPKDDAKIVAANTALMKARLAWATKASELFTKVQASTNKLSDSAVARLVASAPGSPQGGRGGRGGFGGFGGPGGPGGRGPGGGGPGGPPGAGGRPPQ